MAEILLITSAQFERQPMVLYNPPLSLEGKRNLLENIKPKIPKYFPSPKNVLCGTGERHFQTAEILGLKPTYCDPIFGCGDLIKNDEIILSGNRKMLPRLYLSITECFNDGLAWILKELLKENGDKIIVIDPFITRELNVEPEFATIYEYTSAGIRKV